MANEVKILLTVEGNTVKIQEVSQEITKLGQTAEKAGEQGVRAGTQAAAGLDGWAAAAGSVATQLLGVMGVVASVAGAAYLAERAFTSWYSLISGGISIVDDYQKKIISTSYILTTMSDVKKPDLSKAYGEWKEYFEWAYLQALDVDKRVASSAQEVNTLQIELAKKGVIAKKESWKEDIETIGRLTDLMKAVTPLGRDFEQQARGEVQALMEGLNRPGEQTAQILSQIDPEFKKNILSARKLGTELEYIRSILPEIKQYTLDLMGTWDAVGASLKSAWSVINLSAFGSAHREVVALATQLSNRLVDNGELTKDGEKAAQALGAAWESAKVSVAALMDYVFNNTDEVVGKVKTVASTVGTIASAAIKSAVAIAEMLDWLDKMYDKANKATSIEMPKEPSQRSFGQQTAANFKDAMYSAPGDLIDKTTSGISAAWDFASREVQGWMMVIQEAYSLADKADALYYGELQKTSDFLSNPDFWKWAIDFEGPKRELDDIKGKIQWVIDLLATPYNFVINAVVTGLPSWFGAAQQKSDPNEFQGYETAGEGLRKAMQTGPPPTPKVRPPGDKKEKGGKGGGGRDTSETLENLILQLRQEEAKLSEGAFAGVDAWYTKVAEKIKKLAMDDQQLKDGMLAASELKGAKEQKISDDLNKWRLGQMHQTTALQMTEDQKKLDSVKGHAKEEAQVREVMAQHAAERADKLALAENQQQKTYYDALAQSSILIRDQVAWKEQSWQLEKKISQAQLEQWFIGKDISAVQKDAYRAMLSLTNAAKDYSQQRQKAVDLGTLEGWAIERAGEALKREKSAIKDLMTGLESFGSDALGQAAQGILTGQKKSAKEIGQTIVQSMVLELNKKSFTKIWDDVAKLIAGAAKSTTGAGGASKAASAAAGKGISVASAASSQGDDPAADLSGAADLLSLSGAKLGLSAGGLLLSGIGIATNSQALVYAGGVLQMVSLAIQAYEMLTATTTMTEFTEAAIALTASATALTGAAGALAAAAGGEGASGVFGVLGDIAGFILHEGGVVAHDGLLVAHDGLNLDERLIKAQVGEWIINRDTTAQYAREGISFDMLNNGRLPVAALPVPFSGGNSRGAAPESFRATVPVTVILKSPEGQELSRRQERHVITLVRKYQGVREL